MAKLKELFSIDIRSLALFRIGLGLIILVDLISRSVDLRAFYTDAGVLPRAALLANPSYFWPVSLHMLGGSLAFQVFLFSLAGLAALSLVFGYRTRLATFVCWILVTSLHARNQFINQAGDTLLHLYLFWAIFLPLAACCSLDRGSGAPEQKIPQRIFSGGTVALLLQICLVYWFAAINKSGLLWRDGTALFYVFNLETIAKPAGTFLLGYPGLVRFLANFTIWLESWGPFLAFVPVANGVFRTFTVILFLAFHAGMIVTMKLGSFPYICMLGWLVFLPSSFWDRLPKAGPWRRWAARVFSGFRQRPVQTGSHWAVHVLALVLLAYVALMNFATTSIEKFRPVFMQKQRWFGKVLGIDQSWAMFAPDPLLEDWRYSIPGKLRDGSEVELHGPGAIPNVKWRKYFNWMPKKNFASFRSYYGNYLCREWNAQAPQGKELESLRIYYLHETVLPNSQKSETRTDLLWQQDCSLKLLK